MWLILFLLLLSIRLLTVPLLTKRKKKQIPPGPPKLPIIGNLHQLGSPSHQSLRQLSRTYGPVMLLRLGSVPAIVVSSPEAAEEALKTHDLSCCSRPPLAGPGKLSYNYLDVGFSPYGEHWREVRKLCVLNLFSQKIVDSFRFIREEETASLIKALHRSSLSPSPVVDLSEKMFSLAASVTFRAAFGSCFGESGLDGGCRFQEMVHRAQSVLGSFTASDFFPYFGWVFDRVSSLSSKLERSFRELDDFFERVIEEHNDRNSTNADQDIVDLMLKAERDQCEIGQPVRFTRDCTKAILMDIFLAGVDTGAITLIWAMTELVRSPRAMKKAQNEIRNCVKEGKLVGEKDLHQLKYLKMVVKETLRLHPPVPLLIPRETMSQFKICNFEVQPKTILQVNVWAIGRDPNYWDEPEEFVPERFSEISTDYKGKHFEFLPFGAGRRGCPGVHMGTAVVELTLANLLCCFDWKLPDGIQVSDIDMKEVYALTAYKKIALELVPISYRTPIET